MVRLENAWKLKGDRPWGALRQTWGWENSKGSVSYKVTPVGFWGAPCPFWLEGNLCSPFQQPPSSMSHTLVTPLSQHVKLPWL